MALFVDNPVVDDLASQLVSLTGKSKVEVVREALSEYADRLRKKPSLIDSIRDLQAQAKAGGFKRMPDEKAFMDELSGGL